MCDPDIFINKFNSFTCRDTVSYYDPLSPLSLLIIVSHQIFAKIACMIVFMIVAILRIFYGCCHTSSSPAIQF
jgi:hypothetical protein